MYLFKKTSLALLLPLSLLGCSGIMSSDDEETTLYSITVNASPPEGGSVGPSSGSYEEGTEVSVEAIAADGWEFVNWTGDMESEENPLTFEITGDTELTANFVDQRSTYTMEMQVMDAEDSLNLGFGRVDGGTDGFDEGLDEEAPPPPPEGALNAYFEVGDLDLFRDFRNYTASQTEWTLQYQVGSGEDFKLEWNLTEDSQSKGSLTLTDSDSSFEVDMFSENSHTISGTTGGTLLIQYSRE